MPDFMINGVPVSFPYEPYSVQTAYMEKVIECLKLGVNGMLESPTGTGKTLSLLCASLSWLTLKKAQLQAEAHGTFQLPNGDFVSGLQDSLRQAAGPANTSEPGCTSWGLSPPQIIYASRTHTQLTQAVQELKKAGFGHMKVSVLGSRDQLCIHPEVSTAQGNSIKITMCQALKKSNACYFQTNLERKKNDPAIQNPGLLDIEDLVKLGQKRRICPYFMARELKKVADIVFMPYNYVLDKKRLKAQDISLENSIIILDEAHNIEKICEESVSVAISSTDVALCIQQITQVMKIMYESGENVPDFSGDSAEPDFTADELCILKTIFLELEKAIDDIQVDASGSCTFPGSYIVNLLGKAQITYEKSTLLMEVLQRVIEFLSVTNTSAFQVKGAALEKIVELLSVVFKSSNENFRVHENLLQSCFKVHVSVEENKSNKASSDSWGETKTKKGKEKFVNLMCFTPSFGMKQLLESNVRCIILTSGTLSPLPPLVSELSIPMPITLENPHVIGPGQVFVSIVTNGPDGTPLNSSFSTRNDPKYIASLGNTILNACRVVPHGVLVFFSSYPIMSNCVDQWQSTGIWSKINIIKPIFVESKSKEVFANTMTDYYNAVQDPKSKGACFFAVTRGKVSEGLDFMDVNGRAVIVTGLPYPPMMDAYVKLKKEYLQENFDKSKRCLTARDWYMFEATRAVNQAIGRIIRHKNDYGAILLCDLRFDEQYIRKALSSWVQPHFTSHSNFGKLLGRLKKFFVDAERTLPPPRVKGPATEIKLPTAVPASFDFVPICSSSTSKPKPSAKENAPEPEAPGSDRFLTDIYNQDPHREIKPEKKIDLFKALEKQTTVIDFNDVSAASSSKSLFKWDDQIKEPKAKKLKLKAPPLIDLEGVDDDALSAPNVLCPSTSRSNFRKILPKPVEIQEKQNDNTTDTKTKHSIFIKEAKRTLDRTSYQRFITMTINYQKNEDIKQLKESFCELIRGADTNLEHLVRGFRSFVLRKHREEFDKFYAEHFSK